MEKPKVRLVNVHPIHYEGKEMLLLSDGEGISESPVLVSKDLFFLISLMDGTKTLKDLQESYVRKFGSLIFIEKLEEVVEFLDKNYLLLSERFESRYKKLKEQFELSSVREAFHAGKSYPNNREELIEYIKRFIDTSNELYNLKLRGLFAPHIDYGRGGFIYGKVYKYLRGIDPFLIIILGTSHHYVGNILNISSKDFSTPLGTMKNFLNCHRDIKELSFFKKFVHEWPHRTEHSIELQLPFIQFFLDKKEFQILPILTGSMEECILGIRRKDEIDEVIFEFKEIIDSLGLPFLVIGGVDLAHIGLQFGDDPVDSQRLLYSRQKDDLILRHIENADANGLFDLVKEERNERKICGFTPLYIQLKLLEHCKGKILGYDQWTDNLSSVSFAAGIFYE